MVPIFSVFRPPFYALKGRSLYAVVYGQAGSTAPLFSFLLPIDFSPFRQPGITKALIYPTMPSLSFPFCDLSDKLFP